MNAKELHTELGSMLEVMPNMADAEVFISIIGRASEPVTMIVADVDKLKITNFTKADYGAMQLIRSLGGEPI